MPPNRMEEGRLLPPLPTAPPRSSSAEVARASFRARLLGSFPISDVLHWGFRKKPEHNAETNSPSGRRIPERSKRRMDSSSSSSSSSEDEDEEEEDGGEAAVEITRDQYKISVSSIVQEVSPTEPAAKKARKDESPPAATPSSDDSGEARNGRSPPEASSSRPWNLRKRRSICGLPSAQQQRPKLQSPQEAAAAVKNQLTAPRSVKDSVSEKRTTLYPSLSKAEIYEDFLLMTGAAPPRRHKKRPAKVQRFIENMYPELSTPWITADLYKVPEEKGKKR